MTTVAWDGKTMACDTMACQGDMRIVSIDKIFIGPDFLVGSSGNLSQHLIWYKKIAGMKLEEVLEFGYPDYEEEKNFPSLMIASKNGLYQHIGKIFYKKQVTLDAIGSGREYAIGAMSCGKTAREAVEIAMRYDVYTGGEILEYEIPKGGDEMFKKKKGKGKGCGK